MSNYDLAVKMAQLFIPEDKQVTRSIINDAAKEAIKALRERADNIEEDKLIAYLESLYAVHIGECTILDDNIDHVQWLQDKKSEIEWDFWNRYEKYLKSKGMSPAAVRSIDDITDKVLARIEDPKRTGVWDRRGMVVGHVQSGKTGNYTGLICKAADAGYKVIIVLAGIHNNLRSQTQLRLDEGFLGFDSQIHRAFKKTNTRIGAGKIPTGDKWLIAHSATSSHEKGDFNTKVANQYNVIPGGGDPVLLVVKKNK
ncbi:MAG: endonuclease, partial [Crenarchaeota archaeon]|nr:endonuclease [Thermoproteota archaeon]